MTLPVLRLRHVWIALPVLLGAAAIGSLPLRSWEYWWHVSAGAWGAQYERVLDINAFLYTLPYDHSSLSQPWLAQRALYWMQERLGLSGSLLARNALVTGALTLIAWELRREKVSPQIAALALLAALGLILATVTLDASLFAWPLGLLMVVAMRRLRRAQGSEGWLLLSIPLGALWAQLHGSFLLPSALLCLWAAARVTDLRRRWRVNLRGFSLVGVVGVALLTALTPWTHPAGLEQVYAHALDMARDERVWRMMGEWMMTRPSRQPGAAPLFYLWLLAGGWFFLQRRRVVDRFDLLLFVGSGALALAHAGGLLWFALVAPLTLTPYVSGAIEDMIDDEEVPCALQLLHAALIAGLLAGAITIQPGLMTRRALAPLVSPMALRLKEPLATLVTSDTPLDATRYLVAHPEHRRIFHHHRWAGLLLWALDDPAARRRVVFVDQRVELPEAQIWNLYESISQASSAWRLQLEAHDVTAALVDPVAQSPLHEALAGDSAWRVVSQSPHHTLFVRAPYPELTP